MQKRLLLSMLTVVGLLTFLPPALQLQAQGDTAAQWKVISVPVPFDSFYSRFRPSSTWAPFFLDSVRGYSGWQSRTPGDTSGAGWYSTDDGGRSWKRYYGMPPVPHTMRGLIGVAENGSMTTDGGTTWTSFFGDSANRVRRFTHGDFSAQSLPQVMAVIMSAGNLRLLFTIDGGKTWTYADTVVTRPDRLEPTKMVTVLNDTTLFGVVPTEPTKGYFHWGTLLGINGDTLYITTRREYYPSEPATRTDEFWAINLRTRTARHWEMGALHYLALNNLQRSAAGLLYAWNYPKGIQPYFVRSPDNGRTWQFAEGYDWADFTYFRFLSPTYGISSNAVTTDGGATWKRWGSEWTMDAFFAADSLHLYAVSARRFLRSTDGGRTWQTGGNLWSLDSLSAIYAWKNKIIVGAGIGNLLVSVDSAEHWVNLRDREGALPAGFSRLRAVAVPDTAGEPNRIVALAAYFSVDSNSYSAVMMESVDSGMTWQTLAPAPDFDAGIRGSWTMQFVPNGSGEGVTGFLQGGNPSLLYRSTDGGRTWQFVNEETLSLLAMADDRYGVAGREGELLRTTDGGTSWTVTRTYTVPLRFTHGLTAFDRDHYAGILPNNLQQPYEWRSIHSGDGGASWSLLRGLTYQSNDPGYLYWRSPQEVYSISQLGLLYSSDSGKRFSPFRSVLRGGPNTMITSDGSYLYQFSGDSAQVGRWRIQDFASSVSDNGEARSDNHFTLNPLESPVRDVLRVRYVVSGSVRAEGGVYDTWGRRMIALPREYFTGEGIFELNVSELASGVYFLRLSLDGKNSVRQVRVVR